MSAVKALLPDPVREGAYAIRLAHHAAPRTAAGLICVSIVQGAVPVAAAWLAGSFITAVVGHARAEKLLVVVVLLAAVAASGAVGALLSRLLARRLQRRLDVYISLSLSKAVNALPTLEELEAEGFHDSLRLAQQAGALAPADMATTFAAVGQTATSLIGFVLALVVVDPRLAIIVAVSLVPTVTADVHIGKTRARTTEATVRHSRRLLSLTLWQTDRRAAKEIRSFRLGEFLTRKVEDEYHRLHDLEARQDRREFVFASVAVAFETVGAVSALLLLSVDATAGRVDLGRVAVTLAAITSVRSSVAGLSRQIGSSGNSLLLLTHYRRVLDLSKRQAEAAKGAPEAPPLRSGVRFQDVWFRYAASEEWVLRGISFFLPVGGSLAIVGVNGAGKSTLIKLLAGLLQPDRGTVLWDGRSVCSYAHESIRGRQAVVFQDYMEYELTASENIGVGDVEAVTNAWRITGAAKGALVHEVLTRLPRGYGTMLSRVFFDEESRRRGTLLSQGQWQRVAIARALMRRGADLVMLDEPASALDAEAEQQWTTKLLEGELFKTTLLITHRLSAARRADRVLVISDGRVVEYGSHEDLMRLDGRYATLFGAQAEGYAQ